MTTMEDLGRRAVACAGWRWMPGMRALSSVSAPMRIHTDDGVGWYDDHRGVGYEGILEEGDAPDLEDPATIGCLEALVREVHGGKVWVERAVTWFRVDIEDAAWSNEKVASCFEVGSYAEALVCALEVSP